MAFELTLINKDFDLVPEEQHDELDYEVVFNSPDLVLDTQREDQEETFELYLTHASIDLLYAAINLANYYKKSETYSRVEVNNLIASIATIRFEVVQVLPRVGQPNVIYLVPSSSTTQQSIYDEYIYVNGDWEQIGSTAIDLTPYAKKTDIHKLYLTSDGTSLGSYNPLSQGDTTIDLPLSSFFEEETIPGTSDKVIKLKSTYKGLYTTGFISARGLDTNAGGGSSTDLLAVWRSLTNNSTITTYDSTTKISQDHIPALLYAGSSTSGGPATSANKLNTNDGSSTKPVYFGGGIPIACTYYLKSTLNDGAATYAAYYSGSNEVSASSLIQFDSINSRIGLGGAPTTYKVKINGTLGVSDIITLDGTTKRIVFGTGNNAPYIEVDSDGYLHTNVGIYSDNFISARGLDPNSGGGGSVDLLSVWRSLTNDSSITTYDANTKIALAHIPDLSESYSTKANTIKSLSIAGRVITYTKGDDTTGTLTTQDTTYESKSGAQGGTDLSLVTTGEKYSWNATYSHISRSDNPHNTTWSKVASKSSQLATPEYIQTAYIGDGQVTLQKLAQGIRDILDLFEKDTTSVAGQTLIHAKYALYSHEEITAGGIGSGGGGGGAAIWGAITGTLSNQTDLMAALNGKASASHTHTIGNITGLQDALNAKQALITSSNKLAYSLISGTPDLSVYATTSALAAHTGDTTIHITASERSAWNGKQDAATAITTSNIGSQSVAYATSAGTISGAVGNAQSLMYSRISGYGDYYSGAIQIREVDAVLSSQSDWTYAPAISFHWGDRVVGKFGLRSDGNLAWNNNTIYHSGNLTSSVIAGLGTLSNSTTGNAATATNADRASGLKSIVTSGTSYDVNTLLENGGVFSQYGEPSYWVNAPSGMLYGSVAQIVGNSTYLNTLALQVAWDINHNSTTASTRRLWFRARNNKGWANDWKEIYHSGNCNNTSTAWSASSLTLNGAISGATTGAFSQGVTMATSSGNVGIGTSTPSAKLEVNGCTAAYGGKFNNNLAFNNYDSGNITGIIAIKLPNTVGEWDMIKMRIGIYTYDSMGASEIVIGGHNWSDGNWYNASASIHGSYDKGVRLCQNGSNWYVLLGTISTVWSYPQVWVESIDGGYGHYYKWCGSTTISVVTSESGFQNIRTPHLAYAHFASVNCLGNITANGEITAGSSSDARFKDNQSALRNANAVLSALKPMEFDWNALYHSLGGQNEGHDVGFLAQDVQPLIPSAIGKVYGDYLRLDYNKVTPYLVAGWQNHETEIDRLKKRVHELENRIAQLS